MNENEVRHIVKERLQAVEERLAAACQRAGRKRSEVTLVAVTKTVSAKLASLLPELGLFELGENRPQELWHKAEVLGAERIHWHMIGHLQRNKLERTLPLVRLIHSIDSDRLLLALESEAAGQNRDVPVLLQFNASGETSKHGYDASPGSQNYPSALLCDLRKVRIVGLMTMAALQDPEACRPCFVRLRELRDELQKKLGPVHTLEHLSMGMSNDFEVAVEEGATLVRLGTVLFGELEGEPTC